MVQPRNRSTLLAAMVWSLGAIFYFYEIMLIVAPSVMKPDLMLAFSITDEASFGILSGSYYFPYAFMQIPVGLLMDRFGPRALLTMASTLCAFGCVLLANAHIVVDFGFIPEIITLFHVGVFARVLMGLGGSFAVVGCLKLACIWFPINRFAFLTGIMVAVGMMGAVSGQTLVKLWVNYLGWQHTLMLGALLGIILAAVIWIMLGIKAVDNDNLRLVSAPTPSLREVFKGLWLVIISGQIWIASIFAALLFMPTTGFGQLWGIPYLEMYFGKGINAGWIMAMLFLGWGVGGPLYGWISDKINRRKSPMWFAAIGTLVVMLLIMYLPVSLVGMKFLLFLLGALSSGFILAFSLVRELGSQENTGTAIGFINTLNNASGLLAQPIIGKLIDVNNAKQISLGLPIDTLSVYNMALLFIPACLFLSLFLLPFIRETFCRPAMAPEQ